MSDTVTPTCPYCGKLMVVSSWGGLAICFERGCAKQYDVQSIAPPAQTAPPPDSDPGDFKECAQ